jgi:hypothetical protein
LSHLLSLTHSTISDCQFTSQNYLQRPFSVHSKTEANKSINVYSEFHFRIHAFKKNSIKLPCLIGVEFITAIKTVELRIT